MDLKETLMLEAHGALQVKSFPYTWNTLHLSHFVGRETEAKHEAGNREVVSRVGTVTAPLNSSPGTPSETPGRESDKSC